MGSLLNHYGWHEWLCHSNFSFLIGASHPHEYVQTAAEYQYRGLCMTDYDGVYGIARAYRASKGLEHPLAMRYGAEIHFTKDHHLPLCLQDTLVLIATSHLGYFNLCQILSVSHKCGKRDAHIEFSEFLKADVQDLIAIQPMRGLIRRRNPAAVTTRWQSLRNKFGKEGLYAAVTRVFHDAEDVWIHPTYHLAQRYDVDVIFTQDAYMHHPRQKDMSDTLQAMRHNICVDHAVAHMFVNAERSLHSLAELEVIYGGLPQYEASLKASVSLAERCCFDLGVLRYCYPQEMIPAGHTAQSFLTELAWQSARQYYGESIPAKIEMMLGKELALIEQLKFADYFLTVWDIVRWARSQNILCQGRGSAANSAVCFVLGITAVDPNIFELLFERFLSVERGDPPDIDVDFEHERREEVIQYIYQRYGRHRAAMVANVICFKTRGAIRFVAKALGLNDAAIAAASEYLSVRAHRRNGVAEVFTKIRALPELTCVSNERLVAWADLSARIKGFPRHLGIHSGGFILSHQDINHLVAQEPATMPNRSVVQWCKEDIEALGFFKIDVLALGMLTAIRKCLQLIQQCYQRPLSLDTIPGDDAPTYAMIQKADTVGTFQIESRAQMSMLPRLKPKVFYDLVIEVAIIRPGPITGGLIHPYLRRRNGEEPIKYAHPSLVEVLKRTLGVPIFQEQVMRIAMEIGDFTPGEADALRRHMGSWQIKGDLGPWIERLVKGMRRHGVAEEFIAQLVGQLKGFSEYGFPESHAASFALLAYASSYLKCHYPAAFCVALLNSQPMGFYSPHALIRDVMRHHVKVLPICVQRSEWETRLEPIQDGSYAIRLGLHLVTSLRQAAADVLVMRRSQQHSWRDLDHFLMNCGLSRADLACLAAADALHSFGVERRDAIWLAEAASFCPFLEDLNLWHRFPVEDRAEKIQHDFRATSTTLGDHPSLVLKQMAWHYQVPLHSVARAEDLVARKTAGNSIFCFGMVLVRQAPPSAKGMVFFTLEDETGYINLVFTPQVYEKFAPLINRQSFLCVGGVLQSQEHAHSVLVRTVYEPHPPKAQVVQLSQAPTPANELRQDLYVGRNYM